MRAFGLLTPTSYLLSRRFSVAAAGWVPAPRSVVRLLALNDLHSVPGAYKKPKRVGRGPGSGLGKTCGQGHKGTFPRHALHKRGFEGGQTKLWKATPKHGFIPDPEKRRVLRPLALDRLLIWIRDGRIDTKQPITMKVLSDSGILGHKRVKHGVKLMGRGCKTFKSEFEKLGLAAPRLTISDVSELAKQAIESVGGNVELVWMARKPLLAHLKPERWAVLPRSYGIPPKRLWKKFNFTFPADRLYLGLDKAKTFPNRTRPPPLDLSNLSAPAPSASTPPKADPDTTKPKKAPKEAKGEPDATPSATASKDGAAKPKKGSKEPKTEATSTTAKPDPDAKPKKAPKEPKGDQNPTPSASSTPAKPDDASPTPAKQKKAPKEPKPEEKK